MKFEIESKSGLTGSNGTRQILALLAAFQHRQIRIEDVGAMVRPRAMDQNLAMDRRRLVLKIRPGQQPLAAEIERTNRVSAYPLHSLVPAYVVAHAPPLALTRLDCSLLYIQTTRLQAKI